MEFINMKNNAKQHIQKSLEYIKEIGEFCLKRKEDDGCKALLWVSSNFDSVATLLSLLIENYDNLQITCQDKSVKIDLNQQVNGLIADQSRFTFIATMSILEHTAKSLSLKNGLAIDSFLKNDRKRKNKPWLYLGDVMYASEKMGLITTSEKNEWDFFIKVRNSLVHNNGFMDKDTELNVNGKRYFFKKDNQIKCNIQSLFIFSKRIVELFYDWSQKHDNLVNKSKNCEPLMSGQAN